MKGVATILFVLLGTVTGHAQYRGGIGRGDATSTKAATCLGGDLTTWYLDADGDGFGNTSVSQTSCFQPVGYVANNTDCNDALPAINPNTVWYLDADNDGYYTGSGIIQCSSPGTGYRYTGILGANDCDDTNPNIWQTVAAYLDNDGDGYTASFNTICIGASLPSNYRYTSLGVDCDDNDPDAWQSAHLFIDLDDDGYDNGNTTVCFGVSPPQGFIFYTQGADCNDNNSAVNPGVVEICGNGIDDDCDGGVDEDCITCTGAPPIPGNILGFNTNVCAGSVLVYAVQPVSGATGYYWSTTGAANVTGGQGTSSATITFASNFTTGSVRVQAFNDCDTSAMRLLSIKSASLPTPGVISGPVDGVCANSSKNYSIAAVAGATGYAWSVGGGDVSISGNPTGTSATFNFGPSFTTGVIRVQALNACGGSGYRTLSIRSVPNPPTLINGQLTGVIPGTSGNYSTPAVTGATSYLWEVTGNATINAGATTTTANVGFASNYTGGIIRVRSTNACGNSIWRSATITAATPKLAGPTRLLNIFPNPASNMVTIQSEDIGSIILYDVSGKVLQAQKYQSEYQVELKINYPAGIYFIEVSGEGWREVRKLVVE